MSSPILVVQKDLSEVSEDELLDIVMRILARPGPTTETELDELHTVNYEIRRRLTAKSTNGQKP